MISPFSISSPFQPMYDECIGYVFKRDVGHLETSRTQIRVCIFPMMSDTPLVDYDASSDEVKINVMIPIEDIDFKPQIGDVVITSDNIRWGIKQVSVNQGIYDVVARKIC